MIILSTIAAFAKPIATIACTIAGAQVRRALGGWNPLQIEGVSRWWNRLLCHLVAFLTSWASVGIDHPGIIILHTIIIGGVMWAVQGHGWAHGMGTEADFNGNIYYETRPGVSGGTIKLCIAVFLGNYAVAMMVAGIVWSLVTYSSAGLIYGLLGLLTPLPHIIAQRLPWDFEGVPVGKGLFLDSRTAIGELGLGAIVYGGMPLAAWIAG